MSGYRKVVDVGDWVLYRTGDGRDWAYHDGEWMLIVPSDADMADDEPLYESWLQSIAHETDTECLYTLPLTSGARLEIDYKGGGDWYVYCIEDDEEQCICLTETIRTRGQFRRLCSALGIKIRETP